MTAKPTPIRRDDLHAIRCPKCGWFLYRASTGSTVETKCPKCKTVVFHEAIGVKAA